MTEAERLAEIAGKQESPWSLQVGAELRRLQAENEALRKDAERLDWLEQNKQSLYTCTHEERVSRTTTELGFDRRLVFDGWACGMQEEAFKTPRAAIDAARLE